MTTHAPIATESLYAWANEKNIGQDEWRRRCAVVERVNGWDALRDFLDLSLGNLKSIEAANPGIQVWKHWREVAEELTARLERDCRTCGNTGLVGGGPLTPKVPCSMCRPTLARLDGKETTR